MAQHTSLSKKRINREKLTMTEMMVIYCHDHHHSGGTLCEACNQLLDYARRRLDTCPFQEEKPACNHCSVHCYSKEMRERVQVVMRYAGPKMILRHPLLSFHHMLDKFRDVPELTKGGK
jgi:predicted amidophosphoribosyltransferase